MTSDELAKQLAEHVSDSIEPEVWRVRSLFDIYRAQYPPGSLRRNWKTYQTRLAKLDYEMLQFGWTPTGEYIQFEVK